MKDNQNIKKAFEFAEQKHSTQVRKGSLVPYIWHIYDVAKILYYENANEETIIAGILHDTLEDTQTTEEEIEKLFGKEILKIVKSETENKSLPYKERKQEKIDELKLSSIQTKLVKCADMLSNLTDIKQGLITKGENLWEIFNAPKETIAWYYKSMAKAMNGIEHHQSYKSLTNLIFEVFDQ